MAGMFNNRSRRFAALMPLAFAAPGLALAQTNDDSASTGKSPDTGTQTAQIEMAGDPILVTATRNPIDPFSYPGMASVVGREEIRSRQASTPDDMLNQIPNVAFSGGPRRTGEVPSIRGFSGPDVVVSIDGARQNFVSGHDGRFFLDPSLIREAEVLRGGASSLYGSGGQGGVIAFRTVRPEDYLAPDEQAGVTLAGGYQSVNEEPRATATAYGRPNDKVSLLGSATYRESGTIELGDGTSLNRNDHEIVSGLAKGTLDITPDHRLEASFQTFRDDAEEPNNGQGIGGNNLVDKDIRNDTARLSYRYDKPGDNLFDLSATAYYTDTSVDELRLDGNGAGPQGQVLERQVETLGLRVDNRSRVRLGADTRVTFTYGVEGYRDEQEGAAGSGERGGVPDATASFAGTFAQAEARFAEPFGVLPGEVLIIPGLRFDHFESSSDVISDDTQDQAISPRIGMSYLPSDWSMLFANYNQAFRAPSVNEIYQRGIHFPVGPTATNRFVPNPNLDPQTTQTVEFGGGLDVPDVAFKGDRAHIKVSHFRTYGDDFIDLQVNQPVPGVDCNPGIPGDCDGTTRAANIADAELYGTEIEGGYENRRIRLNLGFSTIDGENENTGEKLGLLTPSTLDADTRVKLPELDAIAGWRVTVADDFTKVNNPAEERDGYIVNDFYAAWSPDEGPLEGLRLDVGIDNAFDESYARVFTGANEPGRNVKALVSYSLNF